MKFRIDMHVHSKFSGDNYSEPEEIVLHALSLGLQGVAFTEHYSFEASEYAEVLRDKHKDEIMIFRGVEYSTAEGHCLIFGLNTDRLSLTHAPVEDIIRVVSECGGVIIPSHPFRGVSSIGDRIERIKGFSAIEGYNGYTHYDQNMKAVEAAKRLKLPCTGGSDAHDPKEVGVCYTEFNDVVTHENFVDLLRAGNYQGVDMRKVSRGWEV